MDASRLLGREARPEGASVSFFPVVRSRFTPDMALRPGTRLGHYEIQSLRGAGGMGEVYRALDVRLDRAVAIKVLPAAVGSAVEFRERFEREAKVIAALSHPSICALYDVGEAPHPETSPGTSRTSPWTT